MHPLVRLGLKALNRAIGRWLPPGLLARRYAQGRIHIDDQMLRSDSPDDLRHYFTVGPLAVAEIDASFAPVGRRLEDVASCLILPSGYGRASRCSTRSSACSARAACSSSPPRASPVSRISTGTGSSS
ncbi:MAG TPA: hypothetical protein VFD84_14445 [Candidatus Binatia bacterium]|jgi:hypothetical protein|nr:hypothetical protein [Candidatus Binatia bacterium]